MKLFSSLLFALLFFASCVPMKRYEELVEKEQQCSTELTKYKAMALDKEAEAAELRSKYDLLSKQFETLKEDTTTLGREYRTLRAKYDRLSDINEALENNYDKLRLSGAKELAQMHADLTEKKLELQKKEDQLMALEKELTAKEHLLSERERRVKELEKMMHDKDAAVQELKDRVSNALRGFENKGLKVEERNGKIYVSLEARLLFSSGSIEVQPDGVNALRDLSKVLESEKDLEIIVEGHTDTDKMAGTQHPKNNWELSVLRSTSVINIMLNNSDIDPKQLMAGGRGEFIPVDENDKAKNRRIEIIISPNLNELYELISQ